MRYGEPIVMRDEGARIEREVPGYDHSGRWAGRRAYG